MPFPNKKYSIIYADPPWDYGERTIVRQKGKHGKVFSARKYYGLMCKEDIQKLKVPVTKDAWLILWATATKLPECLKLIEEWGFEYRTCAIWDKEHLGLGWFFRIQHEVLLIGKKGNPPTPKVKVRSIFKEKRTIHSKKPKCVISWIEKAFPNCDKLEMFARTKRQGWDVWGNEVPTECQNILSEVSSHSSHD